MDVLRELVATVVHTEHDYHAQRYDMLLFGLCFVCSTVLGIAVGFVYGSHNKMLLTVTAVYLLMGIIILPSWPTWRKRKVELNKK